MRRSTLERGDRGERDGKLCLDGLGRVMSCKRACDDSMTFCVCSELDLARPVCSHMPVQSRTMHNYAFFQIDNAQLNAPNSHQIHSISKCRPM
jgi:hypothetical protein